MAEGAGAVTGIEAGRRCFWCAVCDDCVAYLDYERGFPAGDDRRLFAKVCLDVKDFSRGGVGSRRCASRCVAARVGRLRSCARGELPWNGRRAAAA
jgi:hypothetical protein